MQEAKGKTMANEIEQIKHLSERYKNSYEPDVDAGWAKFQARMQSAKTAETKHLRLRARRQWLSAAAAILLIAVAGIWVLQSFNNRKVTIQTGVGKSQEILLADGSVVVLNENSKLIYSKNFNQSSRRTLELSGEAYFDVQPNASKPFVITTPQTKVTVLGTAFNVRAYPQEATTEVEVTEGKVQFSVRNSNASLTLNANEKGVFDTDKGELYRKKTTQLNAQAWRTHQLSFIDTPLAEVFQALERYYKVTIEVSNPAIGNCDYTSNFERSDFAEVAESLALGLRLKIEKTAPNRYVVSGEGCQ